MRPLSRTLLAAGLCFTAFAAPRDAGAQSVEDTVTKSYDIDGLRILHHRNRSNIFAVQLYLLGGSRQVTSATAGIEPFLLLASDFGTEDYPGEEARRARAVTGSSHNFWTTRDWTVFSASGVRDQFLPTWSLFTSRLLRPSLDTAAMKTARLRLLASARSRLNSPQARAAVLAESLAFAGHPYAVDPAGSESSLEALTADDLRAYAKEHLVRTRMLLVVVGDIPREQLDSAVTAGFASVPRGSYEWTMPPQPTPQPAAVAAVSQQLSTDYVVGYWHGPSVASPEYPAFEYSMGILSSYLSSLVREQAGLSYSAGVSVDRRGAAGAAMYVSTTNPDSVVKIFNRLVEAYEDDFYIPRHFIRDASESFRASYLFGMETSGEHAAMLGDAFLYSGDHRAASRRAEVMTAVGATALRRAVRNYAKQIQYGFVGDTTRLPRAEMTKR